MNYYESMHFTAPDGYEDRTVYESRPQSEQRVREILNALPMELKNYVNDMLLPALNEEYSKLRSETGASIIGAEPPVLGYGNTVQAILSKLQSEIVNVVLGQLPNGSIPAEKLTAEVLSALLETAGVSDNIAQYLLFPKTMNTEEKSLIETDSTQMSLITQSPAYISISSIRTFGCEQDDPNWLLCDQSEKLKTDYPELSQMLGKRWGTPVLSAQKIDLPILTTVNSVRYLNGFLWAVGNGGIYRSQDGEQWENVFSAQTSFYDIAYGNGRYIAPGSNNSYYSNDGLNWIYAPISGQRCVFAFGKFYTASQSGRINYSTDGLTWNNYTIDASGDPINDLAATSTCLAARCGDCKLYFSTNGTSFSLSGKTGYSLAVHENKIYFDSYSPLSIFATQNGTTFEAVGTNPQGTSTFGFLVDDQLALYANTNGYQWSAASNSAPLFEVWKNATDACNDCMNGAVRDHVFYLACSSYGLWKTGENKRNFFLPDHNKTSKYSYIKVK